MSRWTDMPIVRIASFTQNDDGTESIRDIVETSGRHVSLWFRRARRDTDVVRIVVCDTTRDLRKGRVVYKGANGDLEYTTLG